MLMSPEAWFPERPVMPAGLLAMMLGSSVDAAAPANALPRADALFSRIWNPVPQLSPIEPRPIPAAKAAASPLDPTFTASSRNCMANRLSIRFSPNLFQSQGQNRTSLSGMGNHKSRLVPIEGH